MIVLDYLLFVFSGAAVVAAASMWARSLFPDRPWSRVLAIGVLAIVEVVLVSELLGTFGFLRRGPLTLATIIIAAGTGLFLRGSTARGEVVPVRWPLGTWPTLAVAATGAGLLAVSLGRPTTGLDTLQYHYPLVAHWLDMGDLTTPKLFSIGIQPWFYPSNGELLQHWAVTWFHQDFLVSLVTWATFGLAAAALIGICRRLGVGLVTGLVTALAVLSIPVIWGSQLRSGQVDLLAAALGLVAVYFGLCWWQSPRLVDAVLGGAALGLAAGTKYVALPAAILLGGLFAVVVVVAARRRRIGAGEALNAIVAAAAAVVVTGAFFYVRNWWIVGNPLFPGSVAGLQGAWMPLDIDKLNITILDYILDLNPHPWILASWAALTWIGGIVAVVAIVGVPIVIWWRRAGLRSTAPTTDGAPLGGQTGGAPRIAGPGQLLVVCWVVPLLLLGTYVVAPTSAGGPMGYPGWFPPNVRYGFGFIAMATTGAVCVVARIRPKAGVWLAATILAANVAHVGLAVVGVLRGGGLPPTTLLAGLAIGVVTTGLAWAVTKGISRFDVLQARPWYVIGALCVVAAVAGAGAAWIASTDQRFGFFPKEQDVAFDVVHAAEREQPGGFVVAFSNWPWAYPLYGTHLQNTVLAALDENTAGPGEDQPSPGVGKPFATADELVAFMREHGVEYFVARDAEPLGSRDEMPVSREDLDRLVDELDVREDVIHPTDVEFALSRPDAFRLVAHDGTTYVFQVTQP